MYIANRKIHRYKKQTSSHKRVEGRGKGQNRGRALRDANQYT